MEDEQDKMPRSNPMIEKVMSATRDFLRRARRQDIPRPPGRETVPLPSPWGDDDDQQVAQGGLLEPTQPEPADAGHNPLTEYNR